MAGRFGAHDAARLVDLGCGSGCFLRFAAGHLCQRIVGIDANPMAIRLAQERCAGLLDKISLQTGDIGNTGLAAATFDGAVSLDVLLFVPDKEKVLREVARILKPGARFAGTTLNSGHLAWRFRAQPVEAPCGTFGDGVSRGSLRRRQGLAAASRRGTARNSGAGGRRVIHPVAWTRVRAWAKGRPSELADSRRTRFCVRLP